MKNIIKLGLLSLLALPLMAGCGGSGEKTSPEDKIKSQVTLAYQTIGVKYNAFSSSAGISLCGSKLAKECTTIDGFKFTFTYKVEAQMNNYMMEYVKLGDYFLDVIIPETWELPVGHQDFAVYKLFGTAKFSGYAGEDKTTDYSSFVGKEYDPYTWNVKVVAMDERPVLQTISDMKENGKSGDTVIFRGYVAGYYEKSTANWYTGVFIADGEDGAMLYSGSLDAYLNDLQIGTLVQVAGEFSLYNGLIEIKPVDGGIAEVVDSSIEQPVHSTYTTSDWKNCTSKMSGNLIAFEGLTNIQASKCGDADCSSFDEMEANLGAYWTFTAKLSSTNIRIYVNYHVGKDAQQALITKIKANASKAFNFYGVLSWYNEAQASPIVCAKAATIADCFEFVD